MLYTPEAKAYVNLLGIFPLHLEASVEPWLSGDHLAEII